MRAKHSLKELLLIPLLKKEDTAQKKVLLKICPYIVKNIIYAEELIYFFEDGGILRERKKRIAKIYDGYILQLYAQYHCLVEMGYKVNKLELYSMDTNKIFDILKPEEDAVMQEKFEKVIEEMNSYSLTAPFEPNKKKCEKCIYFSLCDKG